MEEQTADDFTVKENISYIMATIKNFLEARKILLDDEE